MASPYQVLAERYPTLAGEIQQAAQAGYSPEEIQQAVNTFTARLRTSGLDPAQTFQTLTGQSPNAPAGPGDWDRVLQTAIRGATLGLAGKHYEPDPYASELKMLATDWAPELVSNLLPFKLAGKAVAATGLPAKVAGAVAKTGLPKTLQGAITSGAVESATFGGVGAVGEGIDVARGQEFDLSRILQDLILGAGMGAAGGWARTRAAIKKAKALEAKQAEVEAAAQAAREGKAREQAEFQAGEPDYTYKDMRQDMDLEDLVRQSRSPGYGEYEYQDILRSAMEGVTPPGHRASPNLLEAARDQYGPVQEQLPLKRPAVGPQYVAPYSRYKVPISQQLDVFWGKTNTVGPPERLGFGQQGELPLTERPRPVVAQGVPQELQRTNLTGQLDMFDPQVARTRLLQLQAELEAAQAKPEVIARLQKMIMALETRKRLTSPLGGRKAIPQRASGPIPMGAGEGVALDQATIGRLNEAAKAQGKPEAPATFSHTSNGSSNGKIPPFDQWTLTQDIPGHPAGSTVSSKTLIQAGYQLPAKPVTLSPAQQGLRDRARQVMDYWQTKAGNYLDSQVMVESKREGTFKRAKVVNEARAKARVGAIEVLRKKAEAGTLTAEEAAAVDRMHQNMLDNTRKQGRKPKPVEENVGSPAEVPTVGPKPEQATVFPAELPAKNQAALGFLVDAPEGAQVVTTYPPSRPPITWTKVAPVDNPAFPHVPSDWRSADGKYTYPSSQIAEMAPRNLAGKTSLEPTPQPATQAPEPPKPSQAIDYFGEGQPEAPAEPMGTKTPRRLTPEQAERYARLAALPERVQNLTPKKILQAYQAGKFVGPEAAAVRQYLLDNLKVADPLQTLQAADVAQAKVRLEKALANGKDLAELLETVQDTAPGQYPAYKKAAAEILRRNGQRPEAVIGPEAPNAGEVGERKELSLLARNAEAQVPAGVVPGLSGGRPADPLAPERVQALAQAADTPVRLKPDMVAEATTWLGERGKLADDVAQSVLMLRDAAVSPQALAQAIRVLPPGLKMKPAVLKAVQKARAQVDERPLRHTKDGKPCVQASPCEAMPEGWTKLSDKAKEQMDVDLAVGGIQRNLALEKKGLLGTLRRWSGLFKEGGLWEFRSPSEVAYASQDPAAIEMVKLFDDLSRQESRWRGKVAKQANEKFRLVESSEDDILLGSIMNNPEARNNVEFMKAQPQHIRDAFDWLEGHLRETAQMRQVQNPEFTALPDYFTHVFDGKTLRAEAEKMIQLLRSGQLPAGLTAEQAQATLKDMLDVVSKIDAGAGESLTYRQLPQAFKEAFFEHRYGFKGYSLSAVKAAHSYTEFFARKYFWEPYLPKMKSLISQVRDPNVRHYMTLMARDLTGLGESNWSRQVEGLSAFIRNTEFIRTLGTWNVGSALRNLVGGHLFAAADAGTKHFTRGFAMALESNRDKLGFLARTMEQQGHMADIPVWYAKTANNPIGNAARFFAEKSGALFNAVERGNRRTSFFAGLSKWFETAEGRQYGKTLEQAIEAEALPPGALDYANRFVQRNQFRYGKADTPWALRGPIGGTVLQYAAFKVKAMEMLWRWATQEGAAGKMRLATLAALGAGVTYAGHLAGVDLSSATGMPIDFLSVVNAAKSMERGDLDTAKRHLLIGLKNGIFETPMGPIAPAAASAYAIGQAWLSDQPVEKRFWKFMERDVAPTQGRAIWQAYQNLEAGGTAEEFVARVAGFPNSDTRIRLAYLQLLKDGRSQQAQDLLRLYKQRTGGTIPVEIAAVRKARIEAVQERIKSRLAQAQESPEKRLRRNLPEHVTRLIP